MSPCSTLLSRPLASRALLDDMNFLRMHPARVNACHTPAALGRNTCAAGRRARLTVCGQSSSAERRDDEWCTDTACPVWCPVHGVSWRQREGCRAKETSKYLLVQTPTGARKATDERRPAGAAAGASEKPAAPHTIPADSSLRNMHACVCEKTVRGRFFFSGPELRPWQSKSLFSCS